jgi:hypothetical protein
VQRGSLKVIKNRQGVRVWRAQWREDGRGRTRLLGRCADIGRAEARQELDKILAPLNCREVAHHSACATLRRFVEDEYLIVKTRVWKASTRSTTEQIIETHILGELGGRSLSSLTRRDLQLHLDQKAGSGLSFSVVAHIRWQLVAIFQMAGRWGNYS